MIEPIPIQRTNGQLAFMADPKSHWFGWIFYKHPDGQWVSLQNMNMERLKLRFAPKDFDWVLPEVGSSSFTVKLADFANNKLDSEEEDKNGGV